MVQNGPKWPKSSKMVQNRQFKELRLSMASGGLGYRLQVTVTGYRLQATGYRLQVTGYRLQVTGYRL